MEEKNKYKKKLQQWLCEMLMACHRLYMAWTDAHKSNGRPFDVSQYVVLPFLRGRVFGGECRIHTCIHIHINLHTDAMVKVSVKLSLLISSNFQRKILHLKIIITLIYFAAWITITVFNKHQNTRFYPWFFSFFQYTKSYFKNWESELWDAMNFQLHKNWIPFSHTVMAIPLK